MLLKENRTKLVLIGQKDMVSVCLDSRLEEFEQELMNLIKQYKCSDFERTRAS